MKKLTVLILSVAAAMLLSVGASAAGEFKDIEELYGYWETKGYPDYVSSVCSTDGTTSSLMVLLTDPAAEDEIRDMLKNSGIELEDTRQGVKWKRV